MPTSISPPVGRRTSPTTGASGVSTAGGCPHPACSAARARLTTGRSRPSPARFGACVRPRTKAPAPTVIMSERRHAHHREEVLDDGGVDRCPRGGLVRRHQDARRGAGLALDPDRRGEVLERMAGVGKLPVEHGGDPRRRRRAHCAHPRRPTRGSRARRPGPGRSLRTRPAARRSAARARRGDRRSGAASAPPRRASRSRRRGTTGRGWPRRGGARAGPRGSATSVARASPRARVTGSPAARSMTM